MLANNTHNIDASGKRTYTVEEITEILGISKSSAYELVRLGQFKAVKIGASIRISKKSFDDWLDSQNENV